MFTPTRIVPYFEGTGAHALSQAACVPPWLQDDDILDDELRHFLRTYTTPRHGSNGQVCWPIDEVDGDD